MIPMKPVRRILFPWVDIKSDLVPLDMNTAWVTGVVYAPGEVYLYRTNDGGHRWMQVALPIPPGAQEFELGIDRDQMKFVSPTDGYLALRMSGDCHPNGRICHSGRG